MSWNYRVIRKLEDDGTVRHAIHEVYYDDAGRPNGYIGEPAIVVSWARPGEEETLEGAGEAGLQWHLDKMQEALLKPVLNWETDFYPNDSAAG